MEEPVAGVEDEAGERQLQDALDQLAVRARDAGDEDAREPPGGRAGEQRGEPAEVDRVGVGRPPGLAQEREHGRDQERRLDALAQRDHQRAEEGHQRAPGRMGVGFFQQRVEPGGAGVDLPAALD